MQDSLARRLANRKIHLYGVRMNDRDPALQRAIDMAGGQSALAAKLDPPAKPQAVQQWKTTPPERVLDVARAVDFQVTPHELRRDLYPYPDDGLPPPKRGGQSGEGSSLHP